MALSREAIKQVYEVMNQLDLKEIRSFPPEFYNVEDKTYGIDKKADGGWENLFFFKKNPTPEFAEKWDELRWVLKISFFQFDKRKM